MNIVLSSRGGGVRCVALRCAAPTNTLGCLTTRYQLGLEPRPLELNQFLEINEHVWGTGRSTDPSGRARNTGRKDSYARLKAGTLTVDDFELLRVLGKGSFGKVVRACDCREQRTVAVKVIRNKTRFHKQALVEVKVLQHLRDHGPL